MIQEFHISITPIGEDHYWLRTEAVAPGVPLAEAQFSWPVGSWLQEAESLFQDPLLSLLNNPSQSPYHGDGNNIGQHPAWILLGQSLYQHLFQERIRDSWLAAQGIAQHRRQTLRLRLGFKDSRLQRLPWELIYGDDRPLATGTDVSLCRFYQALGAADLTAMRSLPAAAAPINILVVISAPDDQERLSLRQEVQTLMEDLNSRLGDRLEGPQPQGNGVHPLNLNLKILEQPGRPELVQALEQGQFQVFHYAGHSDVSETGGELYLVNQQTGLTDWLSGEDLAGLLVNNGIRLAVFNSCRGAYTAADDAEAGWREQNLVQALVNRGVPGVIAMAERIPDDVAVTFTRLLYRNLQQGYPIDLCLSRVRQGLISAYRSDQPFWMLPILYLRPDFDGYLYARAGAVDLQSTSEPKSESVPLTPPDYSADPDISGLAAEILSSYGTPTLPDLASLPNEALSEEISPGEVKADQTTVDSTPSPDQATETQLPLPPPPDLIRELERPEQPTSDEAAAVSRLVQQLSHPSAHNQGSAGPAVFSPVNEPFPPPHPQSSTEWGGQPPCEVPHQPPATADKGDSPDSSAPLRPNTLGLKTLVRSGNPALWFGLGVLSLCAASILALVTLTRINTNAPTNISLPVDPDPENTAASPDPNIVGRDSEVITLAVGALADDRPAAAAKFIHQLLDRGDLEAVAGVLANASPGQLLEPEIAFARGQLAWQEQATGRGSGTGQDALRYWATAVEADADFLEAWVALGFAHYSLGEFNPALAAWEKAVELDRQALRDIDASGQLQVASDSTLNAYMGLAMVNQKLGELNPVDRQKQQYLQRAKTYFSQVVTFDPGLLNPEVLGIQWLWSPALVKDWQTTVNDISTADTPLSSD